MTALRSVLRSIAMAFTLFSRLPMPQLDWQQANMRYVTAALPLVGLVIAALLQLWLAIAEAAGLGALLYAAVFTLLPVLLTGGIHLDGLCDTADALASRAPAQRKQEILKDPRIGAFAAIAVAGYLLMYLALSSELARSVTMVGLFGATVVLSRAVAGIVTICSPTARTDGLHSSLHQAGGKAALAVCWLWVLASIIVLFLLNWACALAVTAAVAVVALYLQLMSARQFGGMSGDLAGFFIQMAELAALAALVITDKVV
jgi:adenosylcobinamide-GDP ribazoletransferase